MTYQLYYFPGACSMAVHVLLNELGQEVELIKGRDENGEKNPELLKANPRGAVPTLVKDGKVMTEGGAILAWLCDENQSDLLPKSGWERAQALQWLMFANSTLHPAYGRTFWINSNLPEDQREGALKTARSQIQGLWDYIEKQLADSGTPYLAGEKITAGDILVTVIANWNAQAYKFGPKTQALLQSVSARPAYQKALAAEDVEYKAAA